MATVRFSEELRNAINVKAHRMFDSRLEKAKQCPEHWGVMVYDAMFGQHKAAMDAMPEGYFRTDDDINLSGIKGGGFEFNSSQSVRLPLPLRPRLPLTVTAEIHGLADDGSNYGGWVLNGEDPRWDAFKLEYATYNYGIRKIKEEQKAFVTGVDTVTKAFSTLAPALKEWPPLWDLLPTEKQEKHKEIVHRVKKEVVVEGVDLNKMTAISAMAKFSQGGN